MSIPTYRFRAAEALNYVVGYSGGIIKLVEDDYGVKTEIVAAPGATIDDMFISRLKARNDRGVTEATIQRAERFLAALHHGFIFGASALLNDNSSSSWTA